MVYNLKKLLQLLRKEKRTRQVVKLCDLKNKETLKNCMIIRCDVERSLAHALSFANILKNEKMLCSFYFHTRSNGYDANIIKKIQKMGHEVGFHHECLDRCKGDFSSARELFLKEVAHFRKDGVPIKTVCMHGEGGIRKEGYNTNRELFQKYPNLIDQAGLLGEAYFLIKPFELVYASDTFRGYSSFYKNIHRADNEGKGLHVLIHPHRWHNNFLISSWQISLDLKQWGENILLKKRNYQTVLD